MIHWDMQVGGSPPSSVKDQSEKRSLSLPEGKRNTDGAVVDTPSTPC